MNTPTPLPDLVWTINGVTFSIRFGDGGGKRVVYFVVQSASTGTWSEPISLEDNFDAVVIEQYGGNVRNWIIGRVLPTLNAWLARVIPAGEGERIDVSEPEDPFDQARELLRGLQFSQGHDGVVYARLP